MSGQKGRIIFKINNSLNNNIYKWSILRERIKIKCNLNKAKSECIERTFICVAKNRHVIVYVLYILLYTECRFYIFQCFAHFCILQPILMHFETPFTVLFFIDVLGVLRVLRNYFFFPYKNVWRIWIAPLKKRIVTFNLLCWNIFGKLFQYSYEKKMINYLYFNQSEESNIDLQMLSLQ